MDLNTVLKHLAWAVFLMAVLQVVFHFVLQIIDYSSFMLGLILSVAVLVALVILFLWRMFKAAATRL